MCSGSTRQTAFIFYSFAAFSLSLYLLYRRDKYTIVLFPLDSSSGLCLFRFLCGNVCVVLGIEVYLKDISKIQRRE